MLEIDGRGFEASATAAPVGSPAAGGELAGRPDGGGEADAGGRGVVADEERWGAPPVPAARSGAALWAFRLHPHPPDEWREVSPSLRINTNYEEI